MLLGIVAIRAGQGVQIRYDGQSGTVVNNAAANQFIAREYPTGVVVIEEFRRAPAGKTRDTDDLFHGIRPGRHVVFQLIVAGIFQPFFFTV